MIPEHTVIRTIAALFKIELERSSRKNEASLPFICYEVQKQDSTAYERIQVISIGGTICVCATVNRTKRGISLSRLKTTSLPEFKTESGFLHFVEQLLSEDTTRIGLNFAYQLKPTKRICLDGILVRGSKEHTFHGLEGKPVGKTIEQYIKRKLDRDIRVSVANDTICLLLSGLTKYTGNELAAGIVGTGMNFAIFLDEHTAVNLESANFNKFEQTSEGKLIDKESVSLGTALFEKETSGAYLYKHFNIIAERNGLKKRIASSKELSKLAESAHRHAEYIRYRSVLQFISASNHSALEADMKIQKILNQVQDDYEKTGIIAQMVLDRSAQLVACQIAGIVEFQKRDLTFVMQGSLFWKGYTYKEMVGETVKRLTNYNARFVKIENADLLGAAKLVV